MQTFIYRHILCVSHNIFYEIFNLTKAYITRCAIIDKTQRNKMAHYLIKVQRSFHFCFALCLVKF